jgi:hypothetical protein
MNRRGHPNRGTRRAAKAIFGALVDVAERALGESLGSDLDGFTTFGRAPARDHARDKEARETIEGMAFLAYREGRITRSKASKQDRTAKRCPDCSHFPAKPMAREHIADVRRVVKRAGIDDAVAFAFAKTTVLVTVASRPWMCRCDLLAWANAVNEHRQDPAHAWRSIGVVP